MPKSILGTRIRERRRAMGVTQAEMSRRIGISASYLNLIERNKRGIAGPLLRRAATRSSSGSTNSTTPPSGGCWRRSMRFPPLRTSPRSV